MNNLITFSVSLFLFLSSIMNGQHWGWANHFDFRGIESRSQIGGTDKDGNVYLTVGASSADHRDSWTEYYFLKVNAKGSLEWSKKINEFMFGNLVTDKSGNSFITTAHKLARFNSSGELIWEINTPINKINGKISLSNSDGVVLYGTDKTGSNNQIFIDFYDTNGSFKNSITVNHTWALPALSADNLYIATTGLGNVESGYSATLFGYKKDGSLIFQKPIPHTATIILADNTGAVYIYGWHEIFPVNINGTTYSKPGHYLVKYDSDGNLIWYKIVTGNLGGNNICLDQDGNLYYTIDFSAEIHINEFEIKHPTGGLLIVKFDPEGNKVWDQFTPSYNTGPFGYVEPEKVYADSNGDLFLSGRLTGTLQFGNTLVHAQSDMYSELFVGKIDQTNLVGISKIKTLENPVQVYPNPSGDIFTISGLPGSNNFLSLTVTDVQGRIIISEKNLKGEIRKTIDLSAFPKGVYLLQVNDGESNTVHKLVKN